MTEYVAAHEIATALRQPLDAPRRPPLDIFEWRSSRFIGDAPEIKYLVSGAIPLGIPGLIVSQGDTGKSMIAMELCRRVAFGTSFADGPILGGSVDREGTAVFITSEDDEGSVHRRLASLDTLNTRNTSRAERLIIVSLPSAGGSLPLFKQERSGMVVTDEFRRLRDQILTIDDLAVVVLDPLQSFTMGPINEDPAAGQFVCTETGAIAAETGATFLYAHHMRKTKDRIATLQDARDAVRGTTALIDGVRVAFALWPANEDVAKKICKELGRPFAYNAIAFGGIIKANGPARRTVRTYARNDFGLLVDVTHLLKDSAVEQTDHFESLITSIQTAARLGQPFTKAGQNGVFEQKARLAKDLAGVSKNRLAAMVNDLLERKVIVQAMAVGGGSSVKWLDVPSGPFASGDGMFQRGAVEGATNS